MATVRFNRLGFDKLGIIIRHLLTDHSIKVKRLTVSTTGSLHLRPPGIVQEVSSCSLEQLVSVWALKLDQCTLATGYLVLNFRGAPYWNTTGNFQKCFGILGMMAQEMTCDHASTLGYSEL